METGLGIRGTLGSQRGWDLEIVRQSVAIVDVLTAAGVEHPRRGRRMACPLHGGDNPTSFSFTGDAWHCFACGAGGDVFALVQALSGCDFSTALARVVALSGVAPGAAPIERRPVQRQRSLQRRRETELTRWFTRWLLSLVEERTRCRQRVSTAAAAMDRERNQQNPDTRAWDQLERSLGDLAAAEYNVARLEPESYEPPNIEWWARLWLAEHQGAPLGVRTPSGRAR